MDAEHVISLFIICISILIASLIWTIHDYNLKKLYLCEECANKKEGFSQREIN